MNGSNAQLLQCNIVHMCDSYVATVTNRPFHQMQCLIYAPMLVVRVTSMRGVHIPYRG